MIFLASALSPAAGANASTTLTVGEKLTFNASWLFFDAGRVIASIPEIVEEDGRKYMRFSLNVTTTNTIGKIFWMDDHFDSYYDMKTGVSRKLVVRLRETSTYKDKIVEFHHDDGKAIVTTVDKEKKEVEEYELAEGAKDFLSAGHFARTRDMRVSDIFYIPVFEDNKNYNAEIKIIKKERIPLMGGEVDTIMVIPRIKFEGAFRARGKFYVWFTDDEYRIPVKVKADIFIGSVVLTLDKAEGVNLNIIQTEKK